MPSIQTAAVTCDPGLSEWSASVALDAWSDGSTLFLTDGALVEAHALKLVQAAPDESSEVWSITLDIVGDPDDARNGASSQLLCSEAVAHRLVVWMDQEAADCDGAAYDWPESVPECPDDLSE